MIGNLSFEEHVRHFTEMYNYLKSVNQHLDVETIVETIRSKVMIVQEWENITYNLNIKDVHNTAMVKDFKKWSNRFYLHDNENEYEDDESSDELRSQDEDEEDDGDLLGLENYLRNGGEGGGDDDDEEEHLPPPPLTSSQEEDLRDVHSQNTKELDEEDDIVDSEDEYLNEEGITPEERLRRQRVAKQFRRISRRSTHVNNHTNHPRRSSCESYCERSSSSPPDIPDDY